MRRTFLSGGGLAFVAVVAMAFASASALAAGDSARVLLGSQGKSGIAGTARLTAQGELTIVSVTISGGEGNAFLPDIRSGTCAGAADLPEIPLAMTTTSSQTTIDMPLDDLSSGSYVIMLHSLGGNAASLGPENALACGEIGGAPGANSAPSTGVGPGSAETSSGWRAAVLIAVAVGAAALAWRVQQEEAGS